MTVWSPLCGTGERSELRGQKDKDVREKSVFSAEVKGVRGQ